MHGSKVCTDEAVGYDKVSDSFIHDVVNHLETYVDGQVHTNGIENFWTPVEADLEGNLRCCRAFSS